MPLSSGKPLYFLSIPKTAGTTLYHILATYFPMDQALFEHVLTEFKQKYQEKVLQ